MIRYIFTLAACLLALSGMQAQVTTSSIKGTVSDESGLSLPGATVIATHVPSGTSYGVVTRDDGGYAIPNMRIGGPYKIEASYTGFQPFTLDGIYLKLGERRTINIVFKEGVELEQVTVVGDRNALISRDKTGASTAISLEQLQTMPTITRSTADLTRLNPMAAEGGSFGGRNDQFNNFSLDGSIFNNPFGLDASTPGGQTDAQPVSLDAIEQISVSIAPYDVTKSGFTGAGIDAVTKSGTNEFKGSVFGYFRNKDMIGVKVDGAEVTRGDLRQLQTGFSLGGPLVKNKVFFFANLEVERRSDLGSFFKPNEGGQTGGNISRVLRSDMELVAKILKDNYGYDSGAISDFKHDTDNQKGLFKLNFNLSDAHKLALTYNFLDAKRDKPAHPSAIGRRGPDFQTLQFENSGYTISNVLHSGKVELNSIFGNKFANKFQAGYTAFRDSRSPFSKPFPVINIGKDGVRYIVAGHEPFSIHNRLDQDVYQFTNNFNVYLNKHNLTFGTSFERFDFNNSFNLTAYGARVFFPDIDINDVEAVLTSDDFAAEVDAARAAFTENNANDGWALAETNLGQWALYAQDEISVNEQFTLTLGLRMDMPLYFNTQEKIQENIDRNCCYDPSIQYFDPEGKPVKLNSLDLPDQTPLINPRVGFNYDVKGDQTSQLRGGTGLFSGRFPFVWIGNQVANPNSFFYVTTAKDFKFPQVWRTNIGYDQKFGDGWSATVDLIFTKDLQAQMVRNYGLSLPSGKLAGVDNRPIYLNSDRSQNFGGPTNAYVFTNTDLGRSFNASFQIEKSFGKDMHFSLAYNFLDSKDAASIDAEISSDAYDRNPANIQHSNRPILAQSIYGNRHRIVGSLYKRFTYAEKWATHIAVFMETLEGARYSYTYSGDINNDGSGLNDLLYIPTDAELNQMTFGGTNPDAQRTAFKNYIEQDDYLSSRRGQYAEKYASANPWYGRWDLRIMQELGMVNGNTVQLSLDILNFANLLNNSWGVREIASSTGLVQPVGVSVDENGTPTYSFDPELKKTFTNDFSLKSRWQAQLGLRYNF
ncbi:MAG TPA: TonB-dependent receptor [Bacteroidetes bacterium]|nr:TonB-dependent receptor [Bacteroidota bacterium]